MKQIQRKEYYECAHEGEEVVEEFLFAVKEFSPEGNLLKSSGFDEDGNVVEEIVNTFEDGRILSTTTTNYHDESLLRTTYEYRDGQKLNMRDYYNETDYIETRYLYDSQGRVASEYYEDDEGKEYEKTNYKYDEDARTKTELHYDPTGFLEMEVRVQYDENENEVAVVETVYYDNYQTKKTYKNSYNANNDLLETVITYDGRLVFRESAMYNEKGDMERQVSEDLESGVKVAVEITRDDQGRVIKKEEKRNGELFGITKAVYDEFDEITEIKTYSRVDAELFEIRTTRYKISYFEEVEGQA